jgi:hypothetical protein
MKKGTKQQYDLIALGTLALLAAIIWVGSELYRNFRETPEVSSVPPTYTLPLDPTLDNALLNKLQNRITVSVGANP